MLVGFTGSGGRGQQGVRFGPEAYTSDGFHFVEFPGVARP